MGTKEKLPAAIEEVLILLPGDVAMELERAIREYADDHYNAGIEDGTDAAIPIKDRRPV